MVRLPHERFNCQGSHSFLGSDYRQEMSQIQSFYLSARAMLSQASLPDTFCQARHVKRDGNSQVLIQDVIEQVQAQLKEAQVTAVSAMNDSDPPIPLGHYTQMDDPDVSQTSGNHETRQTLGVCDMALV